jgi:uncharacterized protein (UPF0332 family)
MSTAELSSSSSEYAIRNAYSRAYYGLFHACYALLLGIGTDATKVEEIARNHGHLHSSVRGPMGKSFERHLRAAYDRRRESDYMPEWAVPVASAQDELKQTRAQFYWLFNTARRILK